MGLTMSAATQSELLRGVSLYFVGMMGAGKSTLAQIMAARLGYRFFDTDTLIEQATGRSIPDIFQVSGEAEFRALEHRVLHDLSAYTRLVVATGGGSVLNSENWGHLRQGVVVWVDVPMTELQRRLQGNHQRPLLQRQDWREHLAYLLETRRPLYAEADIHLPVGEREDSNQICDRLVSLLQERILPPPSPSGPANS